MNCSPEASLFEVPACRSMRHPPRAILAMLCLALRERVLAQRADQPWRGAKMLRSYTSTSILLRKQVAIGHPKALAVPGRHGQRPAQAMQRIAPRLLRQTFRLSI